MSQEPTNICLNCQAVTPPGQSHCVHCGAALATNSVPPTVLAEGSSAPHNTFPPTMQAPVPNSSLTPPPPALANDPYNSGAAYNPYGSAGAPPPPAYGAPYAPGPQGYPPVPPYNNYALPKKKTSPWFIFGIVMLVVMVLICGGGAWGVSRLLGFGISDGQAKSSPQGVNFTYESVNFTVTSLVQAKSFADDSSIYTKLASTARYVRLNLHEKYPDEKRILYTVGYSSGFKLITPDGKSIKPLNEEYFLNGSSGQERDNWMDFKVDPAVENLGQLVLKVGDEGTGEMVMSIPLNDNPDLSKYQAKTLTPNQAFSYANMNWTLKSAVQSFSLASKQVKDGDVSITVSLVANNPTDHDYYMTNFLALIGPDKNPTRPETVGSDLNRLLFIQPHATNVTGTAVFETKLSPTGQYMLYFAPGENNTWPEKQIPLQF